jgi:2-iminobutanoate/2-iminopropanoate deaminase
MDREVVRVDTMPVTNPTYSIAVRAGGFLFLAGQIGFDYGVGRLVSNGIREQTRQTLENIRTVLEAAGSSLDKVVSATVYITDWDLWADFNEVYGEFFLKDGPAKTTAEVTRLAFDALVEIQVVALA